MGLASWLAAHGYAAVTVIMFLSAIGIPMPAILSLLLAGAAAHNGVLNLPVLLALALLAQIAGSNLLYIGGRYTGWWLLNFLCRLSLDPEVCIFRSADFFYQRGAATLLFSRFVPGLNSMAPPLAGSLNMRPARFFRLDLLGAIFFCSAWLAAGYLLSPFLSAVQLVLALVGHVALALIVLAVLSYAVILVMLALRGRKYRGVPRISVAALRERLENPDPLRPIVIADVRSHGYYDPGMLRIKNSIRVEPSRLPIELDALRETLAIECDIYVYCSCHRDATSVRIAHLMTQRGNKVHVIDGGMKSWMKAGCPTEPVPASDMRHLPRFD